MFTRFTLRKINLVASRLISRVSNSNTSRRLGKNSIHERWRSKRAILAVLLLTSSAVALTSLGVWQAIRPASSLARVATSASRVNVASPATTDPPYTKLKEYVYTGGRLVTSEEISCVPAFSPTGAISPQGGGPGSFNFSLPSICSWTAVSNVDWITVTSGASGSGAGTVGYSVAANSGAQRVGTITVNGQAFTVTQAPNPVTCGFSLSITNDTFPQGSGSRPLALRAGAGCAWNAVSSDTSWLTASPTNGVGDATINYSVTANSSQQRVGSISIKVGGQTFATLNVTQSPNQASCTFALSPSSWLYGTGGGGGSFSVTTGAGCLWNAANNDGWITITGGATSPPGGGSGTVSFNVQANNGGSRTGTISVGGQVFTITQCGYTVSPTSDTVEQYAGGTDIYVSAATGCSWSATSNSSWITVTSGANGSGDGMVQIAWTSFLAIGLSRFGSVTVAGQTVTIHQFGPPRGCTPGECCECLSVSSQRAALINLVQMRSQEV